MTAAASQNQPPATSPTAADTFAWVDARLTVKGVRDLHRRLGGSQLPALALVSGGSL